MSSGAGADPALAGRRAGLLEAIDRLVNRGGDAGDVLRGVVEAVVRRGGYAWAGIFFVERDQLVPGPLAGEPQEERRVRFPISFRGNRVGELAVDGDADRELIERVALVISAYVLLGRDTGGQAREP